MLETLDPAEMHDRKHLPCAGIGTELLGTVTLLPMRILRLRPAAHLHLTLQGHAMQKAALATEI
jgi:hypothetical protein